MRFREFRKKQKFQKSFFRYLGGGCEEGNFFYRKLTRGLKNGRTFGNGKKLPPVTTIVGTGISVVSVGISVVSTITVISIPSVMVGISVISTIVMSVPSFRFSISLRFSN